MSANETATEQRTEEPLRVLVADNDPNISELVEAILSDEGYEVAVVHETDHAAINAAVGRAEPDCVLLDGADGPDYGGSWTEAAYLASRRRPVPTVMFSGHSAAIHEAREGASERARAARFAAVIGKPVSIDALLEAVGTATGHSTRFEHTEAAERRRTDELIEALRAAGAQDIRTSNRREWATFTSPSDKRIYQLYWWQRLGRYIVGRYDDEARLELIGHYLERNQAIDAALADPPAQPA
jgi:CheY-like chemotaxis protein